MARHSRRGFIGLSGAGIAGLSSRGHREGPCRGRPADPDLVVFNAKVYTVDPALPRPRRSPSKPAGSSRSAAPPTSRRSSARAPRPIDAKQMTIVPGFIDCHNHAPGDVLLYEVLVGNPYVVEFVTIDSIVDKLRAKARETPPGTWVEGYFFDDTKVKDNRPLNVHDLDQVSNGASGRGASSRRPHVVLQQQGPRDGRHHQEHAQSAGRHLRPRRQRRTQRPRHRPRDGRLQPRRQAADVHRRAAPAARPRRRSRSSPSSSCATA